MSSENSAEACTVPEGLAPQVSFEEARDAFGSRKFWISFFVRPCCPAPAGDVAKVQLEKQRKLVRAREDFTSAQKDELIALIDEGEAWYRTTPYWKHD